MDSSITQRFSGIAASGKARQHNGNVYQHTTNFFGRRSRRISKRKQKELDQKFIHAISAGHIHRIEALLFDGANKDCLGDRGWAAILYAVERANVPVLELLVEQGIDMDVSINSQQASLPILMANQQQVVHFSHGTPLCYAIVHKNICLCKRLLDLGASVNHNAGSCGSALHEACARGDLAKVQLLIHYGASINKSSLFTSPLSNKAILAMVSDPRYQNPYPWICRSDVWLRDCHPLHLAALSGKSEICSLLLEQGTNINVNATCRLSTAIYIDGALSHERTEERAMESGWSPLLFAANVDCVAVYLAQGAAANHESSVRCTKAHVAALQADLETLRLLFEYGVSLNVKKNTCVTPLAIVIEAPDCTDKRRKELVEFLLGAGANVNAVDRMGWDAYAVALRSQRREGGEVRVGEEHGRCGPEILEILRKAGADMKTRKPKSGIDWPGAGLGYWEK
jgi:ankyrin repeat protein